MKLSERDIELIEVALESAIRACVGFPGADNSSTDTLADEYALALRHVRGGD